MTELARIDQTSSNLALEMEYARTVASASMLPDNYRGKPADIMLAVGLGNSMGLSPAESLYRISVIKGKPSANAELIAANVRKAGHRLRLKVTEDPPSATCTIIRGDDPEEPFVVTRDMDWAKKMGLVSNDNYRKQPSTMLSWRAISACARLACSEALYGVQHTPDELGDLSPAPVSGGLAAALHVEQVAVEPAEPTDTGEAMTPKTRAEMFALFGEAGIDDRDEQIRGIVHIIGRPIESRADITDAEARQVIAKLRARAEVAS